MKSDYMRQYDANHPVYSHYTKRNNMNYAGQKHAAKKRNVPWEFTLYTWLEWWINTGHFHERGVRNDNYQMCRINDTGPYSPTNVYCDTGKNNKRDSAKSIVPIIRINPATGEETYYESIYAVCRELNITDGRNITKCVNGKLKTYKGYMYRHA